jgi:hypothetical protein
MPLVGERAAAAHLGVSVAFLRADRCRGQVGGRTPAPPWYRVGRAVRYDLTDLDQWLATRLVDGIDPELVPPCVLVQRRARGSEFFGYRWWLIPILPLTVVPPASRLLLCASVIAASSLSLSMCRLFSLAMLALRPLLARCLLGFDLPRCGGQCLDYAFG